ncbi:uncharacterized protein LOC124436705 isoform X1 [Xenia sp. Carnegie-2017]|uniref:uncharacterized protein LOC124436705 isoform X1 n=1 Tax=Xenia sp. Carnegie-2017 TaxID=2897299 RepID=UPI001F03744C|nr:uncharacterized protein LOC124436705 isoform X1 [Xenia sp. Carnegie-2017]
MREIVFLRQYKPKDLLGFDAVEHPSWRYDDNGQSYNSRSNITVREMIMEILHCHETWKRMMSNCSSNVTEKVKDSFVTEYVYHVNKEEGHGCQTREETETALKNPDYFARSHLIKMQETINVRNAYQHLIRKVTEEENSEDYGLLEVSLLQETHKIILQDLPLPAKNSTRPGQFSQNRRYATFKGETHEYPCPENMEKTVQTLIDSLQFMDRLKQG